MANAEAYRVLQDTSIPKALFLISEDEIQGKLYETEGRSYDAGDFVLASDITPPYLAAVERGEMDSILEPVSLDEALEALNAEVEFVHAPEHAVEHEALVRAGKTVVTRDQVIAMRSEGAEDAKRRLEEAKEDGADERSGEGQFTTAANLVDVSNREVSPTEPGVTVADADESQYADAEKAVDNAVQVTPSGVVSGNVELTDAERAKPRPKARPRAKKDTTEGGSES